VDITKKKRQKDIQYKMKIEEITVVEANTQKPLNNRRN
jgi:hypothetical protein